MSVVNFARNECNENICAVDEILGVCPYCFRTQEEIDYWDEYSDTDKKIIFRTLERRRKILEITDEKQDLRWVF